MGPAVSISPVAVLVQRELGTANCEVLTQNGTLVPFSRTEVPLLDSSKDPPK
jgi:hypothetical protein